MTAVRSRAIRYWARTAIVTPFLMSAGVVALMWSYIMADGTGPLNYYLHKIGISPPNWLASGTWSLPGLVIIDVWATIGFTFIIFLVGLQAIPSDLYEAASIDGANAWGRFRRITLPLLSPATFIASATAFIGAFEIFTWPLIDTNGGPGIATQTSCFTSTARRSRTTSSATAPWCRSSTSPSWSASSSSWVCWPGGGCTMSASSLSRPGSGRAASGSALSAPRLWRPRVQRRGLVGRILLGLFLVIAGVIMLLPVVWVVLQSFEDTKDQTSLPPVWFPSHLTLSSYRTLFSAAPFGINILNSVVVTAAVVIGSAIVSVLAAYAFARLEFRGREVLFTLFLAALTLPSQVSAVPEFVVVKYLHLLNTQAQPDHPGAHPGRRRSSCCASTSAPSRATWTTPPASTAPGHLRIIRHVMVPLSWPAISAVMIITGQYIWNDFFWPNLFINSTNRMTAPLALYNLESRGRRRPARGDLRGPVGAVRAVRHRVHLPAAPPDGGHRLPRHLAVAALPA